MVDVDPDRLTCCCCCYYYGPHQKKRTGIYFYRITVSHAHTQHFPPSTALLSILQHPHPPTKHAGDKRQGLHELFLVPSRIWFVLCAKCINYCISSVNTDILTVTVSYLICYYYYHYYRSYWKPWCGAPISTSTELMNISKFSPLISQNSCCAISPWV